MWERWKLAHPVFLLRQHSKTIAALTLHRKPAGKLAVGDWEDDS